MKASLNWLRELVETRLSDDKIAEALTNVGLEVEGREVRTLGAGAQIVAARVVERKPIEGSDHLSICQVDDGQGVHQVVCGAQNYAAGDVVPMARVGAALPDGKKIGKANLRGVESSGMLCSARELGLGDDHSGLLQLPKDIPVGTPLEKLLGLPDTILEVNVTPNRPDALSHLGIAREISAATGGKLHTPRPQPREEGRPASELAAVEIADADRCPRYIARVIEGVKSGPSPLHIQERLRSCGVRPISNVVDATNLALFELGHPLHGFDLDQVAGRKIVVRRARKGEKLTTLDGKERALDTDDLVIADGEKAVALAGVMGGQTSEVGAGTTRVLLESAVFDAAGVRRTSKRHGLRTEASIRFEKGADDRTAELAVDRCAELIAQLAGGTVRPGRVDVWPRPRQPVRIWVRPARVTAVLGTPVSPGEVDRRLSALGLLAVDGNDVKRLWEVPSWRGDLTREIDCIEEIARMRGYDTIPIELHKAGLGETAARTPEETASRSMRAALAARGHDEVLNYSFVAERDLLALGTPPPIRVANPLTVEQGAMRTSLVAGLLRNVGYNLARGAEDVRLYELGRAYLPERDPAHPSGALAWPVHEPRRLALVATGRRTQRHWSLGKAADTGADFYDLKGVVEDVLDALGIQGAAFESASAPWLHPAVSAEVRAAGRRIGSLGQVHPKVAAHFEVPSSVVVAELDWDALAALALPVRTLHGVPRFPAVTRDLAFVVDDRAEAGQLAAEIRAADQNGLLESVLLFDQYNGPPVPAGKKSLAYALLLRAADRTLTDADADALCAAVVARLHEKFGADQRA